MLPEQMVRACARAGRVAITPHAVERMLQRRVTTESVLECLATGKVLETQAPVDRDLRVLLQGSGDPPFYAVAVVDNLRVVVISVCLFEDDAWEEIGNTMRRRRRWK